MRETTGKDLLRPRRILSFRLLKEVKESFGPHIVTTDNYKKNNKPSE